MPFVLDDLAIAATVGSAGASIFGGIFGASEADRQNKEAQAQYEAQVKQQEKIARKTNEYNKEAFQVDKANYKAQRNYQYNIAKQDWQRQNEIQDFQYLQSLLQEQRDLRIRDDQLNFNDLAAKQAFSNESAALAGLFTQQMFDRQDQMMGLQKSLAENVLNRRTTQLEMQSVANKGIFGSATIQENLKEFTKKADFEKESALIENAKAQGQVGLMQAGGSRRKAVQTTMGDFYRGMSRMASELQGRQRQAALQLAELGLETSLLEKKLGIQMQSIDNAGLSAISDAQFNLRVLDADIASAVSQSERNMQAISLQKYGADLNASAQVMIRPERLSYAPAPTKAPKRIFIKPMEVLPGAVAQPVQQNVWGPLVSGVSSALGSVAQASNIAYARNNPKTASSFLNIN
jgi:hypothetical protein